MGGRDMSPVKIIEDTNTSISAISSDNGTMVLVVETGDESHQYNATPGSLITVPIQVDCGYKIEKTEPICECPIQENVVRHYNIPYSTTMITVGVVCFLIGYVFARLFRRR